MCGEVSGFVKSGDGTTTGRLLDTRDGAFMEYAQSNTGVENVGQILQQRVCLLLEVNFKPPRAAYRSNRQSDLVLPTIRALKDLAVREFADEAMGG
jgi:hypothetical protein